MQICIGKLEKNFNIKLAIFIYSMHAQLHLAIHYAKSAHRNIIKSANYNFLRIHQKVNISCYIYSIIELRSIPTRLKGTFTVHCHVIVT